MSDKCCSSFFYLISFTSKKLNISISPVKKINFKVFQTLMNFNIIGLHFCLFMKLDEKKSKNLKKKKIHDWFYK